MTSAADPRSNRWAVLTIIVLGTFMAILDANVVNVALPHMMSAFGVDREQIEWVATAYMLTSAVVMPLTGWITTRLNYKVLYLGCLLVFTIGSAACAFCWSFGSLILFRVLQALGGGGIQPIGMAMIAELFEPHERGTALGIYGTGIMAGPALGPTLGGYLTDTFNWRTIFSVNVPFGILVLFLGMILVRPLRVAGRRRPFDFAGYGFMAMGLVAALTALSNGQTQGWHSDYIHVCEAFAVVGLVMFVTVELVVESPLLDLRLFLSRNFSLSIVLTVIRAVALFGSVFLFPLFLENLMGFTPVDAGLWMVPGAVAVAVMMPLAGRMADRCAPSYLIAGGSFLVAVYLFMFATLDPLSGWGALVWPQVVRGVGLAFLVAPLIAAALNSVPQSAVPMASSFLAVSQNFGGALGIAFLNTYVTNRIHVHAVRLGGDFPRQSSRFVARLGLRASGLVVHRHTGLLLSSKAKLLVVAAREINQRASVLGYDNGFMLAGVIVLLGGVPLGLLFLPSRHHLTGNGKGAALQE
jgi:EmrB/QacA subfamily drug resistance transporter